MSAATPEQTNTIPAGNFTALPGMSSWEADQLKDAYDAITAAEKWYEMATFSEPSFMMSRATWLKEVQSKMRLLDHHSGASYGCMMRVMECIAREGWDSYVAGYIRAREEEEARKRGEFHLSEEERQALSRQKEEIEKAHRADLARRMAAALEDRSRARADTEEADINRRRFERHMNASGEYHPLCTYHS